MPLHPRPVVGTVLTLVLLGCEAPGLTPVQPTARWGLERVETPPVPAPSSPLQTSAVPPGATAPAPPSPGPSARPASGGGGASAPAGPPRGRVFAYGTQGLTPRPLAGATVWTTDGRTATTGADGRFALTGAWPQDGTWVVHHPAYHASTVVGLAPEGEIELHLKTNTVVPGPLTPSGENAFEVDGRVVDAAGAPIEGLTVLMNAEDGSFGTPALTAADGTFTMRVLAHGATVSEAAFVAIDYETEAWMGLAKGVTLTKTVRAVDFNPSAPGTDPFEVAPTTHTLRLNVTGAPPGMRVRTYLDLAVPGLEPIPVFGHEDAVKLAELPDARLNVRVYAADSDHTRQTAYVREKLAIDFRTAETALDVALLPIPELAPVPAGPLGTLSWPPVAGADGYEVRLDSIAARGFQWEAFTAATALAFHVPGGTPSGRYTLTLAAWEADGLSPRRVASADRAELRVMPNASVYRVSSSETRLEF